MLRALIKVIVYGVPALLIVLGFFAYVGAYTLEIVSEDVGTQGFGFFLILIGIIVYLAEFVKAMEEFSGRRAVGMRCPGCGKNMTIQTVNGYPSADIYDFPRSIPRGTAWVCPNCGKILRIG